MGSHADKSIFNNSALRYCIAYSCITGDPGFQCTCLDVWVLEMVYCAYR